MRTPAALLEDVGDVATRACVTCVEVEHLGCVGCGTGCRWRKGAGSFLNETGNGEAVVLVEVVCIGGVVPLDVCELAKVGDVFVSETAVEEVVVCWVSQTVRHANQANVPVVLGVCIAVAGR